MSLAASPRPRRRARRWVATLAATFALGLLLFAQRYPGLSAGVVNQLRYSTFEESLNLWAYVSYLTVFLEKLTLDPEAKIYNFKATPDAGLGDYELGRLTYHRGRFTEAAEHIEQHIAKEGESKDALFWLALARMRQAEAENCLTALSHPEHHAHASNDPASYCSLPLVRTHEHGEPSRQAAKAFERLLDRYGAEGSDARLYRWLLNLSYMTVGGYPDEVPARYLIATPFIDAFYGEEAERRRAAHADLMFVDRARELGVENFGTGRGVAVEDLDGDGDLDLVSSGSFGGVKFFRNEGGQRFTDATSGSGLEHLRQPMSVSVADYDGNGTMDLFVVCPYTHFHLLSNRGNGTFDDVTQASGLLAPLSKDTIATSWMSAWGDIDNDSDLDLFVAGWAFHVPFLEGLPGTRRLDSKLFVNEAGHFRDATAQWGLAGLLRDRHVIGAAFGDYDGDGFADLYYTGPMPGTTRLMRNLGGRRFAESPAHSWNEPGFTAAFVDINHDGRLDIFHGGFSDARTAVTQGVFGLRRDELRSGRNVIFVQGKDGRFAPRPELFEPGMETGSMGSSYGDLDNDGCLDFYLGSGNPEPWFVLPGRMFRGRREADGSCSGRMDNVSMTNGFGTVQKGHGIAFFDYDGDGDQDVYSSLGGMWPADPWYSQLFVNEGEYENGWVKIRLRGRRSNLHGVGSLITVKARRDDGGPLVRTYLLDGKTGFGSAPQLAHIGLERATAIESVEVRWLGSGCVGRYDAELAEENLLDEADCLAQQPPGASR